MNLITLNPFAPREPKAQAKFSDALGNELKALRRKPIFWITLLVIFSCSVYLIPNLTFVEQGALIIMALSAGLFYDMVTSHYIKRIIAIQEKIEK